MRADAELVNGYEVTEYALPDAGASAKRVQSRSCFLLRLDNQWFLTKHATKQQPPAVVPYSLVLPWTLDCATSASRQAED